jgi:2,3-bisphosphoglycerate-dependent phosphoglycerate mutase
MSSGKLIIVRHSESEYNAKGLWTGITDVGLTEKGHDDARKIGELLRGIPFDKIYVSQLKRAVQTKNDLLEAYGQTTAEIRKTAAINERDYGDYAGKNKWDIKKEVGETTFNAIRRAFDEAVPNGETLKDVYERVIPWYREIVLPQLLNNKNVMIVAHGNSNRAFRKYLESISDEGIKEVEMDFDKVYIYEVDNDGRMTNKEVCQIETEKNHKY